MPMHYLIRTLPALTLGLALAVSAAEHAGHEHHHHGAAGENANLRRDGPGGLRMITGDHHRTHAGPTAAPNR